MSKYYSINEFSKILGVSAQTLRNWDNNSKLHPHHTSNNGYRYYSQEQLNQVRDCRKISDADCVGYFFEKVCQDASVIFLQFHMQIPPDLLITGH